MPEQTLPREVLDVVISALRALPLAVAHELALLVADVTATRSLEANGELAPAQEQRVRFIAAIRSVTEAIGRPPTTTDYKTEYERRRRLGASTLPSVSAIVKHFGTWSTARAAAAVAPSPPPEPLSRRRQHRPRKFPRYQTARIIEALQVCAADLDRVPTVRDYKAWRDARLLRSPGSRAAPGSDIPHYNTIRKRFRHWDDACRAANLDPAAERWTCTPIRSDSL